MLTSTGPYITFKVADFLMKRVLHIFATKLISKDIQKCNCFLVPSYDLFASARKAVFPAPLATGIHRLRNTWSSLLFQLVDNYGTRGECSKGASFKSRIQVHVRGQGFITCNRDWWEGVWGEVICHKKVQQSILNQSLDPPPPIKNSWIRPC